MQLLDTNIVIENPYSMGEKDAALPVHVIFELNKFKNEPGKRGHNARKALRMLLTSNVLLKDKGSKPIKILYNKDDLSSEISRGLGSNDFSIMLMAKNNKSVLRTSDSAMAIIASIFEVDIEYVIPDKTLYNGYRELIVDTEIIDSVAAGSITQIPPLYYTLHSFDWDFHVEKHPLYDTTLMSNEYIKLIDVNNEKHFTYARYDIKQTAFFPIKYKTKAFGIEPMPRNIGQTMFMDALMNPDIKILTVNSEAGAGKSLLALAAAIEQTNSKKPIYGKTYIFRALEAVSEEIGFLPGDANDKVDRWHDSLYDSFELLLNKNKVIKQGITREYMQSMLPQYNIEIGVLTFIRGRSLQNSFIIIDEAQNVTPDVMRTIVTRCGAGTKLVILGDPSQVDNPVCNKEHNGLSHIINSLHRRNLYQYAHITLEKCERSDIAEIGIKYL